MSEYPELSSANKLWRVFLYLSAGLFIASAPMLDKVGLTIFGIGLGTLLASIASNPIALANPRKAFNWQYMPKVTRIIYAIAIVLMVIGAILAR